MLAAQKRNFSIKKAPAGMLTAKKNIFPAQKGPCRHADGAQMHFFFTKRPLRACGHTKKFLQPPNSELKVDLAKSRSR